MDQDNINYGRDQFVINHPEKVEIASQPVSQRDPVLKKLLGMVQQEVKERLAQSLHRAVDAELLNLGKALEPHQVRSPWAMEMSVQESPPQPLPPETTIAQVFELPEVGQKLLILGEPGSGKTTTLLELADTIVERALRATDAPIPVLVNLSSWKNPQQSIFDWLIGELQSKYGIRQELGRKILIQNQLLPFLDGLDEVATSHQEACALRLNAWLTGDVEQQPVGVVVCCRREEYEQIVRKRLALHNSVALQPLSNLQIKAYLSQFQMDTVWKSVKASPHLQGLLEKPLFLAVFGFVAPQFDFEEWQRRATDDERMEYLFDRYWDVAMDRALVDAKSQDEGILSKTYGKKKLPERKKVRRAIVFAAKAMDQESLTELLIEKMQPSWLRNIRQKWQYRLILGLTLSLIFELTAGLPLSLISDLSFRLSFRLIVSPIFGLTFGLIIGEAAIKPVEEILISMSRETRREILISQRNLLIFTLIASLMAGSIYSLISGRMFRLSILLTVSLTLSLTVSLMASLMRGLEADIEDRITPNQGIKNSWQNMLILTAVAILATFLLKILLEHLVLPTSQTSESTTILLFVLIWSSFSVGVGVALLQHIALRIVLALHGYAPYRYDKLLDYCTERLLLQRIGGRYRFMHKLLQEHFAKMPLD